MDTNAASNNTKGVSNSVEIDYDDKTSKELRVKVICLGDSAVGKSKLLATSSAAVDSAAASDVAKSLQKHVPALITWLVERFLLDDYKPQQLSTYALTLFRYSTKVDNEGVIVDFWDTAGQEMFQSMHPSYYHQAHACIMVFDATRKITYKHLGDWYQELRAHRRSIPVLCAANKIDANMEVTQKSFQFTQKNNIPLYYVSASDGTNVVKLFQDAIKAAVNYKKNPIDVEDQIMDELNNI